VDPAAHSLVLPFDTDCADFARGFEACALWADLRASDEEVDAVVHASNAEMVLRMAGTLHTEDSADLSVVLNDRRSSRRPCCFKR
jgi:hypothetical protein